MSMQYVNCDLCGADDFNIVFPKGVAQLHQIVRCKKCGLMYANPRELIDCERKDFNELVDFDTSSQYFQKQQIQLPDNLCVLEVLNTLFPKRGKLLEIGSFAGIFLDQIRSAGWETTGIDPDRSPAEYARTHYNLNVVDGILPNDKLPVSAFDAVVMLHVIEHMPSPSQNLKEIHSLLKPGGVLVIETPRFDSLMFKLLGRRERSLSNCNGHIYFFTVPTLSELLKQNGFEVFRVDLVGRTLTMDRLFYNFGVILRNHCAKQILNKLSAMLRLDKIRLHINVHDMQRIYCKK